MQARKKKSASANANGGSTEQENVNITKNSMLSSKSYRFDAPEKSPDAAQKAPTPLSESGKEAGISDDIEKDINIEVAINNNSACSITHNSNINIAYYNFESENDTKKPRREGMMLYGVWMPKPYTDALEKLRAASGIDPSKLAEEAYAPLLKRFGIPLGENGMKSGQADQQSDKRAGKRAE